MLMLFLILNLDPFLAEISEYKGDKLVKVDTVLCYYQYYEVTKFYITFGGEHHEGQITHRGNYMFSLTDQNNRDWIIYLITPYHLILSSKNRTIKIRGI